MKPTKLLWLVLPVLVLGCASAELRETQWQERSLYERGARALADSEFKNAQDFFTQLLSTYPSSKYLTETYYNLGLAYEGTYDFDKAAANYQKVVDFYQGVHTKESAEALYRLSLCFEALNQDEKLVMNLLQLKSDLGLLPEELANIEWPARMAGVYARLGQANRARQYFEKVQKALKKAQRSETAKLWLPKTYFSMGKMPTTRFNIKTVSEFDGLMSSFKDTQIYLLRAMESQVGPWNDKASENLLSSYKALADFVSHYGQASSNLGTQTEDQQARKSMAEKLDDALDYLDNHRLDHHDQAVNTLFSNLRPIENQIDSLISQRDVQDRDTVESRKLKGPRINGKISP